MIAPAGAPMPDRGKAQGSSAAAAESEERDAADCRLGDRPRSRDGFFVIGRFTKWVKNSPERFAGEWKQDRPMPGEKDRDERLGKWQVGQERRKRLEAWPAGLKLRRANPKSVAGTVKAFRRNRV